MKVSESIAMCVLVRKCVSLFLVHVYACAFVCVLCLCQLNDSTRVLTFPI